MWLAGTMDRIRSMVDTDAAYRCRLQDRPLHAISYWTDHYTLLSPGLATTRLPLWSGRAEISSAMGCRYE